MTTCGQIYHFVQENKSNIRQKLYEFVFNSKELESPSFEPERSAAFRDSRWRSQFVHE